MIQDTAYASLLRSTRQRVHRQIAELLEAHFPETVERQPEVVVHRYTEASCPEPAMVYWQQAGQRAGEQSANRQAVHHLTKGLELLARLPDIGDRPQQELDFQIALGPALMATQGNGGPDVERVYARARELCQQVGETPQLFPVLWGLCWFYRVRGELRTARELAGQLLSLAQHQGDPDLLVAAHSALGNTLFYLGEFASARTLLEKGAALYEPQQHHAHALQYVTNPGLHCLSLVSWALWYLGYPEQALHRSQQARTLAQELAHPPSQTMTLYFAARLRLLRRDVHETHELAEATMTITAEHGIANYLAYGTFLRDWALFHQGQGGEEEALAQMRQGLAATRATGNEIARPSLLAELADAYGKRDQAEEGLPLLAEAWSIVDKSGQGYHNAELHRIEGELRCRQSAPDAAQAEACLQQALDVARHQEAKSWELRAALSLARLWQQQGKRAEARDLLAPIYGWFTEGFDTADLQEAKALLEELS